MFSIKLQLFGGRGSSSGGGGGGGASSASNSNQKLIDTLKDNPDFKAFVKENMSNPAFKEFGRENSMQDVKNLWYETRRQAEAQNIGLMSKEDAIATIQDNISPNVLNGWFVKADSDYKPLLMDSVASNNGVFNASLNIAYHNYLDGLSGNESPMSFETWANTPIQLFRGDRGQKTTTSDIFSSYTPDRSVAESFGSNISSITIKPIDTWGSFQSTGEQEYLIPVE